MKLIYIWIENYNNFIVNQGFQITKDLLVDTEIKEDTIHITIHDNKEVIGSEELYEGNIIDVTAIVGENGAGKTTVVSMLMDYVTSDLLINDRSDAFVQVYLDKEDKNKPIKIMSRNKKVEYHYNHQKKVDCKILETQDLCFQGIFLSNVFNVSELRSSYAKRDMRINSIQMQQMYTPSILLRDSTSNEIKRYGYRTKSNEYIQSIQTYAENMVKTDIFYYIKKQEELYLNFYLNAPQSIRMNIDIFHDYTLEVESFAWFIGNLGEYWDARTNMFTYAYERLGNEQKILIKAKAVYESMKEKYEAAGRTLLWHRLYCCLIAEIYLGLFNIYNEIVDKIWDTMIEKKDIPEIDVPFLEIIRERIRNGNNLQSSSWGNQIIRCIDSLIEHYANNKKTWRCGLRSYLWEDDDSNESGLLKWYLDELKKGVSFFSRYMYFRQKPASSGEMALINIFAYFHDALKKIKKRSSVLLIIDEIDAYLHPRWQQKIIEYLIEWIKEYREYRFQIVITSHSPIILSDFTKDHIVKIRKHIQGDEYRCYLENQEKPTFGASIPMLFYDSFFMDEGNIGEFAKSKISQVIRQITDSEPKPDYSDNHNDYMTDRQICYIINNIGEDTVRRKLLSDYKNKFDTHFDFIKQISDLDEGKQRLVIEYINKLQNNGDILND
jgi:predicted ATPase